MALAIGTKIIIARGTQGFIEDKDDIAVICEYQGVDSAFSRARRHRH